MDLGGTGGEDDLFAGTADELGDLTAGDFDSSLGFPTELVVTACGVTEPQGCSVKYGIMASRTRGSSGVVAWLSMVEGKVNALGQWMRGVGDDDSCAGGTGDRAVLAAVFNAHLVLLLFIVRISIAEFKGLSLCSARPSMVVTIRRQLRRLLRARICHLHQVADVDRAE